METQNQNKCFLANGFTVHKQTSAPARPPLLQLALTIMSLQTSHPSTVSSFIENWQSFYLNEWWMNEWMNEWHKHRFCLSNNHCSTKCHLGKNHHHVVKFQLGRRSVLSDQSAEYNRSSALSVGIQGENRASPQPLSRDIYDDKGISIIRLIPEVLSGNGNKDKIHHTADPHRSAAITEPAINPTTRYSIILYFPQKRAPPPFSKMT